MTTFRFIFSAVDSWFFSDGAPFNQSDAGLSQSRSVFPPSPHILTSAVRRLLEHRLGRWDRIVLGQGLWDLGILKFGQYRLLPAHSSGQERLVPSPTVLSRQSDQRGDFRVASPGTVSAGASNDKQINHWMAGANPTDVESIIGQFVPESHWHQVASAQTIDGAVDAREAARMRRENSNTNPRYAVANSPRIGIAVHRTNKIAISGMLYATSFVEPADDFAVSIDLHLSDPPIDLLAALSNLEGDDGVFVPFGGKGKTAHVAVKKVNDEVAAQNQSLTCLIGLVTPAMLGNPQDLPTVAQPLQGVQGTCITAVAMPRQVRLGPWNFDTGRSWHWVLPAGAVISVECGSLPARDDLLDKLDTLGLNSSNSPTTEEARRAGFGEVLVTQQGDNP